MKAKKHFDCLEFKQELQEAFLHRWGDLTSSFFEKRLARRLATSKDPLVQWWRSIPTAEERRRRNTQALEKKAKNRGLT